MFKNYIWLINTWIKLIVSILVDVSILTRQVISLFGSHLGLMWYLIIYSNLFCFNMVFSKAVEVVLSLSIQFVVTYVENIDSFFGFWFEYVKVWSENDRASKTIWHHFWYTGSLKLSMKFLWKYTCFQAFGSLLGK